MAAAPLQLLGCLSGRGRSRTDRQSMATAVQNPMLPLSTQAGRASGVGFLSQPWCRQMLPGCGTEEGVHAEMFTERKRHLWQAG